MSDERITASNNSITPSLDYNASSYPTLENCLFGPISLTKYVDINEYKYSGHRKRKFSVNNRFGRDCIIFGVDMSSSVYVDNKKKDILTLGKGATQGLDGSTMTAEKSIELILLQIISNFA